jgi:hypothetical protein
MGHDGTVEVPRYVAQGRKAVVAGELICSSRKAWGGTAVSHRSHLQAHSFYLAALSCHRRRESQRRWHESR